jgi:hypothetical protein
MTAYLGLRREQGHVVRWQQLPACSPPSISNLSNSVWQPIPSHSLSSSPFALIKLEPFVTRQHLHNQTLAADKAPVAGLQTWLVSTPARCSSIRIKLADMQNQTG